MFNLLAAYLMALIMREKMEYITKRMLLNVEAHSDRFSELQDCLDS